MIYSIIDLKSPIHPPGPTKDMRAKMNTYWPCDNFLGVNLVWLNVHEAESFTK